MTSKLLPLPALLAFASLLLTACGTAGAPVQGAGEGEPGNPKLMRVWIEWGDDPKQIQALLDKFTAETGIKVEVTAPVDENKILPALTGSKPPDILVTMSGASATSLFREGLVEEFTGAIESRKIDMEDMFPAPLAQCQQGHKIVCLPWGGRCLRTVLEQ